MFTSRYVIVAGLILHASFAQRRIKDGEPVKKQHNFVVYLIKADASPQKYDNWICGGALVTPQFIVTAAACVEDVQHLYAIAGYEKYVTADMLVTDSCTREMKKKVVLICVPKSYDLVYEKLDKWANIDIGVVKVESPYDLTDSRFVRLCSYMPGIIGINYQSKYQEPGTDAVVFGWGHTSKWRKPGDNNNYNQESLQHGSTLIINKEVCTKEYAKFSNLVPIIENYMICTMGSGNLDDAGEQINWAKPNLNDGCVTKAQRMSGMTGVPCDSRETYKEVDETRRDDSKLNLTVATRRHGICQVTITEGRAPGVGTIVDLGHFRTAYATAVPWMFLRNDHGGPLVTWIGAREVLIGVASVFRVDEDSVCQGPYLFTSTQCNSKFLDCVIFNPDGRRSFCDYPPEKKGYRTAERHISWKSHPDGPADNEREEYDERDFFRTANKEENPSENKETDRSKVNEEQAATVQPDVLP